MFTAYSKLSHSVEDVFYIIREHPEKLALIFDSIFDLVFQTSDFLKHELELIQDADYVENSSDHLIAALEEQAGILNGASEEAPAKTDEKPTTDAEITDVQVVDSTEPAVKSGEIKIRVFFDDDCQMENMRAYMLMTQLQAAATPSIRFRKTPRTTETYAPK